MSIEFQYIHKTYFSDFLKKEIKAVKDLNLSIPSGSIFGIIGPNGAGKSTIIKMLMDFIRPTKGNIRILDSAPSDPTIRARTGFLPESPYYYDHLTALELLQFGASTCNMSKKEAKQNIEKLLRQMDLFHVKDRQLRTYSKGMVQRAGICYALVHNPELIIFDEPMSGLDPIGRKMVVDLILDLKSKGKTVLFCSHILNDVERLCDRMAIMADGKLKRIMTSDELMKFHTQIIVRTSKLTKDVEEKIATSGAIIEQNKHHRAILIDKEKINTLLNLLTDYSISDYMIDTHSNALETIFFNTINRDTDQ